MCLRTSEVPHGMPRVPDTATRRARGQDFCGEWILEWRKGHSHLMPHILDDVHPRSFVPSCLSLSGLSFPITSWVYLHAHDETLFWVIRDRISRQAPQETHRGLQNARPGTHPFPWGDPQRSSSWDEASAQVSAVSRSSDLPSLVCKMRLMIRYILIPTL